MSRRIQTVSLQSAAGSYIDGYFDRIVKYIPADVVAAWVAIAGLIAGQIESDPSAIVVYWIAFTLGLALSGVWTWRQTTEPGKPIARAQIAMAVVAFGVWVFALGGPFEALTWYKPYYGSVLLILFTVASGTIIPR